MTMANAERILKATWLHDYLTADPPEVPSLEDIAEESGDEELLDDHEAAELRDLAASAEPDRVAPDDEDDVVSAVQFPDGSRLLVVREGTGYEVAPSPRPAVAGMAWGAAERARLAAVAASQAEETRAFQAAEEQRRAAAEDAERAAERARLAAVEHDAEQVRRLARALVEPLLCATTGQAFRDAWERLVWSADAHLRPRRMTREARAHIGAFALLLAHRRATIAACVADLAAAVSALRGGGETESAAALDVIRASRGRRFRVADTLPAEEPVAALPPPDRDLAPEELLFAKTDDPSALRAALAALLDTAPVDRPDLGAPPARHVVDNAPRKAEDLVQTMACRAYLPAEVGPVRGAWWRISERGARYKWTGAAWEWTDADEYALHSPSAKFVPVREGRAWDGDCYQ